MSEFLLHKKRRGNIQDVQFPAEKISFKFEIKKKEPVPFKRSASRALCMRPGSHTAGKKPADPPSAARTVMPASPVLQTSQEVEYLANSRLKSDRKNLFNELFYPHVQRKLWNQSVQSKLACRWMIEFFSWFCWQNEVYFHTFFAKYVHFLANFNGFRLGRSSRYGFIGWISDKYI